MGWAARAQQSRGNAAKPENRQRFVDPVKFAAHMLHHPTTTHIRVTFSDRDYAIDRRGQFRRLPKTEGPQESHADRTADHA